jgi:hypothetical protein
MTLYRNVSQLCRLSGVSRSACYNTIEKMIQLERYDKTDFLQVDGRIKVNLVAFFDYLSISGYLSIKGYKLQPFNRLAGLNSLADTLKIEAEGRKKNAGNKAR